MGDMQMGPDVSAEALATAGLKALLLFGMVVLVGLSVFRQWVAPELDEAAGSHPRIMHRLRAYAVVAGVLIVSLSLLDVVLALRDTLGFVDVPLLRRYVTTTEHGRATILRVALVVALAVIAWLPRTRVGGVFIGLLSAGGLATFSVISHNAGVSGWLPVPADVLHFGAACAWAGAVLMAAVLPVWEEELRPDLEPAMKRLSSLGLYAVLALVLSGVYSSVLHIATPGELVTTVYGQALLLKLGLIFTIVGLAAFNRLLMLPDYLAGRDTVSLGRAVRAEAVLLLLVLAATGLLTTSPLPH